MIEAYSHAKHRKDVEKWLRAYGMTMPPEELMSSHGYVVDGIAVGFLFLGSNSKIAHIDNIAASPFVEAERRDNALITLMETLERDAKNAGCLLVQTLARLPTMMSRLSCLGYESHGRYTLFYKEPELCHG